MGDEGLEPPSENRWISEELGSSAANSGARPDVPASMADEWHFAADHRLRLILVAWPTLSESKRDRLVALALAEDAHEREVGQ